MIAGIDAGTTAGLALLDLDGRIVRLASRKDFSRAEISKFIMQFGIPILISTDVKRPPLLVEKVAASMPCRLVLPKEDISRAAKAGLANEFCESGKKPPWGNRHERDALASAVFARKAVSGVIQRIDSGLRVYRQEEDFRVMRRFVASRVLLAGKNINASIKEYLNR